MPSESYAYLVAAAILAALLGHLLWRAPPSRRRTATATLACTLCLWLAGEVLVACSHRAPSALLAMRCTYGVIACLPLALQRVIVAVDDRRTRWQRVSARGLVCFALVTGVLLATPLLIADVARNSAGFHLVRGPLFPLFSAGFIAALLAGADLAWRASWHAPEMVQRRRSQYVLVGLVAAMLIGIVDLAILRPSGIHANRMLVVPLQVAVGMGMLVYAMTRSRLVDIAGALRRGLVQAALVETLLVPCLGLSLLADSLLAGRVASGPRMVLAGLFCVAGFAFPRLRALVERALHRALLGQRTDHRRLLEAASREMTTLLSLPALAAVTRGTLAQAFGDIGATLWLLQGNRLAAIDPRAETTPLEVGVSRLERHREPFRVSEVEDGDEDAALAEVLRARGIELAVGLRAKDRTVGLLTLGRRRDDRFYSDGDVAVVVALADQLAIAVENARVHEELRASREEMNRATRLSAVGTLAAGIAHEIRNPLVAVRTFLQLFPNRLEDPEFLATFSKLALSELDRVTALVGELHTFARTHERALTHVDLAAVVERVCSLLRPAATERNVTLVTSAAANLSAVHGDGDQLEQVLLNVVLNAIQASPPGETVIVRARPADPPNADRSVRLEVNDRGPGVLPEHHELIFAPFFSTKDGSTGLGLAVAHHLVAEHGGAFAVTSGPADGTTFTITLPASAAAAPLEANAA